MLIREIILENFMSYEYARIPFTSGVNLICGPNGAGKSSILLGISVALGQSYTERSKKLSDLIRWRKDIGRVTLSLDNSRRNGRRPVPRKNKDQIYLTRVLRRDGKYWFELDNVAAGRADVLRLLARFGVDPDNMLIIMHQDMAEQFIVLSPQEKLKLIEAAVGLEPYRRNVLDARNKLNRILSQEESLGKMLESAEQTLSYWREQYDRYQNKKQLMINRRFLERELAWAQVAKQEDAITEIDHKISSKKSIMESLLKNIESNKLAVSKTREVAQNMRNKWQIELESRISLERESAKQEFIINKYQETAGEFKEWLETGQDDVTKVQENKPFSQNSLSNASIGLSSGNLEVSTLSKQLGETFESADGRMQQLQDSLEISRKKILDLENNIQTIKNRMQDLDGRIEKTYDELVEKRVDLAILEYRKNQASEELAELSKVSEKLRGELDTLKKSAETLGPRIVALRSNEDILDEIRMVDSRISALSDVSEEIERMYESYSNLYLELKEKARITSENREKALEEIRTRTTAWTNVIRTLLDHVNAEYRKIVSQAGATGSVRLNSEQDIEAAGVEISVGFKGSQPVPLDIYSQSGGERSTATMAFLLALQQRIRSPFRAVDEYDIHMDPKNREVIANLLISAVSGEEAQYLAITPNQMLFQGENVHMITVQNIEGFSTVSEVR